LNKREDEDIENISVLKMDPNINDEETPISIFQKRDDLLNACLTEENDENYIYFKDFAVVAFDKIKAEGFSLKGKVAAKNSINTNGYSITTDGNCEDGSLTYSAYTDEFSMNWGGGSLKGGIHYGSKIEIPDYLKKQILDRKCPISNSDVDNIDFNAIERRMNFVSQELLKLKTNAEVRKMKFMF